ncbi:uncharacterized protein LOC127129188 [Lathyrus oleraceus]|uniref:DUF1499 family protein n=1 Tax=Pisum sativum TaxID=3888 RepID=A0A9D4XXW5_PEA|nr:uncharacterized protein LOC127129188 [Pisum sativum]KAI5428972.1 hypothetical protein KIW84_033825 [Pisum sativum]
MALSSTFCNFNITHTIKHNITTSCFPHKQKDVKTPQIKRRELILRSGELATIAAFFNLSGKKPEYLGVQNNPPSLALCPLTKNCISTSEDATNLDHYAPPWKYNSEGREDGITREEAIEELIDAIETTIPPENFTPRIVDRTEDYLRVEYKSPILGLVDDVEFWFPQDKDSIVEYRSASRVGIFDFDTNRRRIKALRLELENRGWTSLDSMAT